MTDDDGVCMYGCGRRFPFPHGSTDPFRRMYCPECSAAARAQEREQTEAALAEFPPMFQPT